MISNPVYPVILCGGSGTRLWPLSRESFPKQYLSINSNDEKSLLQQTYQRIIGIDNLKEPILICNEDHRFIVAEQMREINIDPYSILLEPFGRNTAPAITLAVLKSLENNEDPILLILSSDHSIKHKERFIDVLKSGLDYALKDKLVTFGIIPTSPETGYGYVKADSPFLGNEIVGKNILEFIEKPNLETAQKFIKDKRFTWNSGIFMFKARRFIHEINKYSPEILKVCKESMKQSQYDLDFQRIDKEAFAKCPSISIDVSIMEKTNKGIVLPLEVGWSDIGSWQAVWKVSKKDENNNFIRGQVVLDDSRNCYIRSENRLVAGIGLNNLIVIETNDAILVVDKEQTQRVKKIVNDLKVRKFSQGQKHKKIYRPWGCFESIVEEARWQVKLINVKPGETLSLQMHHHRSEHWIVVSGTAKVEVNQKIEILTENESIYIPLGSKHRLENPGKIPLTLIEVQSGSYVGEDDIIRFDDKYGRNN